MFWFQTFLHLAFQNTYEFLLSVYDMSSESDSDSDLCMEGDASS
jgi:hypothetical protein